MQRGLTGNQLKIIAVLAMTIDHIGVMIFPDVLLLRIIGRLAFPIFAYMIAEGCVYTKNKVKYTLSIFTVALLCQIVYFVTTSSIEQSIFTTFLMSLLMIFSYEKAKERKTPARCTVFAVTFALSFIICEMLPNYLDGFSVDYGFPGAVLPLLVYMGRIKNEKLLLCAVGLVPLTLILKRVQAFSFIAIILLFLYNGKRGSLRLKYFFYIYYPLHLGIIHLVSIM